MQVTSYKHGRKTESSIELTFKPCSAMLCYGTFETVSFSFLLLSYFAFPNAKECSNREFLGAQGVRCRPGVNQVVSAHFLTDSRYLPAEYL